MKSAALWYEDLSSCLVEAGFVRNECNICVFNREMDGVQCTIAVHVDNLIITSVNADMIEYACAHVKVKYGDITRCDGPVLNYLSMMFDLFKSGEVRMTMKGYIEETLAFAGVTGKAKSPATDGLFETRAGATLVSETQREWFHSIVAKLSYLSKKAKPECLTDMAFLATRVTRCTSDDVENLGRVLKYITDTKEMGVLFRPGRLVRVYVDAAYGVHSDGKSHTGSCVVIGDVGAVHCKSSKQSIVTKSSTEAFTVFQHILVKKGWNATGHTPLEQHTPATMQRHTVPCVKHASRAQCDKYPCRRVVGQLMYGMVHTMVDIVYALNILSRYSNNPGPRHILFLKHLLRYIKYAKRDRLIFRTHDRPTDTDTMTKVLQVSSSAMQI